MGGNAAPSLRASATAATAKEEEGAEHRGQAPQPSSQPPPPRARARAPQPGGSRGTCARSPAASVDASAARAPPTPNGTRAPAPPAPTNRYTPRAARGRAASSKVPPAAVRLVPRCEGGAGSPEAVDLLSRPSRRAGKRMRRPWSFRPGEAGRKRERTWRLGRLGLLRTRRRAPGCPGPGSRAAGEWEARPGWCGGGVGLLGFCHPLSPFHFGMLQRATMPLHHPFASFRGLAATLITKFKFSRLCNSHWGRISGLYWLSFVGRDSFCSPSSPMGSSGRWEGGKVGRGSGWLLEGPASPSTSRPALQGFLFFFSV